VASASYQVKAVVDFDGDGRADVLWRGTAAGDMWLWPMNGTTKLGDSYVATVGASYQIVAAGDYDSDGKADLLWRGTSGDLWMWTMNGAAKLSDTYVGSVADAGYQIVR